MNNKIPIYIEQHKLNDSLVKACQLGNLDEVKYLLTSDDLSQHADISCQNNHPLLIACAWEQIDIIEYLLSSSDLKNHPNIHANKDVIFSFLLECKTNHTLKYLILNKNIQKTKDIERALKIFPNDNVESWFKVREWNKEVNEELEPAKNNEKVQKPKL